MKIRSGFVSNSSSSSFVVHRRNRTAVILTKEQEKLLKKCGFTLQRCYYPHQVKEGVRIEKQDRKIANWGKAVVCNQDIEIKFLLENRISFMANIHYDHYSMIYDGTSDKLLIAQNYGNQAQTNGDDKINFKPYNKSGVVTTTGEVYLKSP